MTCRYCNKQVWPKNAAWIINATRVATLRQDEEKSKTIRREQAICVTDGLTPSSAYKGPMAVRCNFMRVCGAEVVTLGIMSASVGRDLVDGIDHGPGSNQSLHHRHIAIRRRHDESS